MLTIYHKDSSFQLNLEQSRDLELKLNVTSKGIPWRTIGDHLYNYYNGTIPSPSELEVNEEQYDFLNRIRKFSSWRDCSSL